MSNWETIFFWAALVTYAISCGGFIYSIVFKNPRALPKLTCLVAIGLVAHSAAIASRFYATGHLPWSGDYEYSLMGGWFIVAASVWIGVRNKGLQPLAAATVPLVVVMMGYGVMRHPALTPMAASLKTNWLYIHVYFAWLAFCSYTLAMAASVLFLLKEKGGAGEHPLYDRFPSLERLDELIFRYLVFGFITNSIMLVAGSIWAEGLWGSYWNWDPVETWSLISYLVYAIAIHLRVAMGWRGAKLAWMMVIALSTVVISFFGVTFVVNTSLHVFQVR
ncbi:cytochrome c biogenesis protein CcsA [Geomesophilobacter sediminis]|uniref:Cytochrome c biogenesis protein CcsA n=1 Tax=Geomesophilobacter sediminis TaxID=2798584 RepID=A0A8J7M2A0_9BACT|nr:cytochrome c biogenesis protein CcsA [Geomesophilobacter sediminis]MBJ6727322.1 cytochrome c biogenesis protein CcsA [Geomesophilobacter sediminis]